MTDHTNDASEMSRDMRITELLRKRQLIDAELAGLYGANDAGEAVGASARDISERIQAEDALRESEARYRLLADATFEGILKSEDGKFVDVNNQLLSMFGYSRDEVIGKDVADFLQPEDRQTVMSSALAGRHSQREITTERKDGASLTIEYHGRDAVEQGRRVRYTAIRDITQRKLIERELQTTLHRFYLMLANMYSGVLLMAEDGRIEFVNQAFCDYYGLTESPDELRELPSLELLKKIQPAFQHPEQAVVRIMEIFRNGERVKNEELSLQGGRTAWGDYVPLCVDGQSYGRFWIHTDITRRKQAEERLRESEERLRFHVENSPVAVVEWDKNFIVTRWAGTAEQIWGWSAAETVGKRIDLLNMIYEEDLPIVERTIARLTDGVSRQVVSANRNYTKDGKVRYCEWYNSVLFDAAGQMQSVMSLVLDVTEREEAEMALQASLHEKEALLKEIHHRVKNNMQVISSLVSLQAGTLDNPALRAQFDDLRDRVRSMALVHERLYQTEGLASVDFAEYTRNLLGYLWRAHGDAAAHVRLVQELQPVLLSVETAVPCGLILNELVTNALKHAFRNREEGTITVRLHTGADGEVCLCIGDNGVGLPAGLDWRHTPSLGLHLVQVLATQLDGAVEVRSDVGAEFQLTFHIAKG